MEEILWTHLDAVFARLILKQRKEPVHTRILHGDFFTQTAQELLFNVEEMLEHMLLSQPFVIKDFFIKVAI